MTLENFTKAMAKADLPLLYKTKESLLSHPDADRLAIIESMISQKEESKPKVKEKK